MNNTEIQSLLKPFIVKSKVERAFEIKDIQWRIQDSKSNDLLFFKSSGKKYPDIISKINESELSVVLVDGVENYNEITKNCILVNERDWLETQKLVLDTIYPLPEGIKIVGITGTNGKSSVVNFMQQIFVSNKQPIVSCGTLGLFINGIQEKDFFLTTPSYVDARKILNKYSSYKNFVFEVSSHALAQERFYKLEFDQIAWTSFSQDHLDYHKTMEEYFLEKLKIIGYSKNPLLIASREKLLKKKLANYPCEVANEIKGNIINPVFSTDFNKSNFEIALSLSKKVLGDKIEFDEEKLQPVAGRFQLIPWKEHFFVVDYAHTPDALENICRELKKNYANYHLVSVFGCGGDRDRTKRPLMAKAVEKYSNKVILTSDNPRFENPEQILSDTSKGFKNPEKHLIEVDRLKAIESSILMLDGPSVILVAGKGHENYLDIKGVKHDYSDERAIISLIEKFNG